ncbi:hypothetical protein KFL_008700010 [Klebsormidium nitens]|uniref:Starch synthase, chloroplastic/amyloplastic n=1 Tax=Klebsormidium nitens TaxID=105231 RepID=A0A1Y1IST3_KLENI|nr:hypothetical protein KFL_008700010 [Klebsormidium nitens]|eukprot:GAQ91856.1 hypothetical protein KFL_008700010 [Klebsormidium nitens]
MQSQGSLFRNKVFAATVDSAKARRKGLASIVAEAGEESQVSVSDKEGQIREQNRRLLAMQKELLAQIEERKKLHAALLESLEDPAGKIKEYNQADNGVTLPPPPPSAAPVLQSRPPPRAAPAPAPVPRKPAPPPRRSAVPPVRLAASAPPATRTPATPPPPPPVQRPPPPPPQAREEAQPAAPAAPDPPPPLAGENVMNVVVVAAECAPWSKTGGLGDVVGALPKALAKRGHRVMVVAPRYSNYAEGWETGVRRHYIVMGQDQEVGYFHGFIDGVDYVFVDAPCFHAAADNIYGGSRQDIMYRCITLCKAAVEAVWHVPCGGIPYGDSNLVFVANDWHTALLPVYLQAYYRDTGLMEYARAVLVIHNMAHQGRGPVAEFPWLGLPQHYLDKFKLYDPIGGEHMNIFMAGLITAHRLVAVSHGYAWECQTQDGGWGLDGVLRDHGWKLRGVVNGIDTQEWHPERDTFLRDDGYQNYGVASLEAGKAACKAALQRELGLPERPDTPLLGFIGRLDYQKGVDIIQQALPWLTGQDCQLVMLGTGRPDLEDFFRSAEASHHDKVRGWVGFSVKMAHRITAGCDLLLMPSRFEPCGLNQLYAMQYGTVPVVHSVGGLRDTVQPFNPFDNSGTGWTFERAEANGLIDAVGNALYTYRDFRDSFRDLQRRGMTQDLSWEAAAAQYEETLVAAKYQWDL